MGNNEPMVVLEQGDYVTWVSESGEVLCGKIYLIETYPNKRRVAWIVKNHAKGDSKAMYIQEVKNLTKIDPAIYKLF